MNCIVPSLKLVNKGDHCPYLNVITLHWYKELHHSVARVDSEQMFTLRMLEKKHKRLQYAVFPPCLRRSLGSS